MTARVSTKVAILAIEDKMELVSNVGSWCWLTDEDNGEGASPTHSDLVDGERLLL